MKELFNLISERKDKLENSKFIKLLSNMEEDTEVRLSYVPHMLYFIMGFKDILQSLKDPNPIDKIQEEVNIHCDEDNGHWKWFLKDLDAIQLENNYLDKPNFKMFSELWSDENYSIRETVYEIIHYGKMTKDPALKMLILEIIEAVFAVYVENMTVLVNQLGMYDSYLFFGRVHYDAENDHSSGSWLDGGKTELESEEHIKPIEKPLAIKIIQGSFDMFEKMFDRWYEQQQQYAKAKANAEVHIK